MSSSRPKTFELRGVFAGFIRTVHGKRRMVLRTDQEDCFLKVPKDLRHHLASALSPGSQIAVSGDEELDDGKSDPKRVVSRVQLLTASGTAIPILCPIRVCTKKNCWRSGGKQLWHAFEESLARRGLTDAVQLEGVDCLDDCDRAPNAEWQGCKFHRCTLADAEKIVDIVQKKDGG
jgi:hypothetical protein